MVPTNFQQKSVRVVQVQFVPRYVYICFLASNLLQHAVPVFTQKPGLAPWVKVDMTQGKAFVFLRGSSKNTKRFVRMKRSILMAIDTFRAKRLR